jgi:hypothetical protein
MTITFSNAVIIACTLLSASTQACLIPGGSDDCDTSTDDCLVTANDLEGTWCNQRSPQTCLTVIQPYSYANDALTSGTRYVLTVGLCLERGRLTGGLEFSPDTDSRMCLPGFEYGLWSAASVSFTSVGLYLYDINQCQGQVCDEDAFVYANDMDLSYVR